MPCTIIILVLIEFESIALLLYGVVSQVHKQVIYVFRVLTRRFELFCGETRETFLVNEDTKGINSVDQGIHTQIKFQVIYQVGVVQVFLRYILVALLELDIFEPSY